MGRPVRLASLRQGGPLTIVTGLLLGVLAFLLVNESFRPFSTRFALSGRDQSYTFTVDSREPLFVEYDLIAHSEGRERPPVAATLNERVVNVPAIGAAYSARRIVIALPFDAVREGANVLRVRVGGADSTTFEMRGRVKNHWGIAPDFPRAAVVGDEAVDYRGAQTPLATVAARLIVMVGLSVAVVWLLGRVGIRWPLRWPNAHILATLVVPLAAVAYSAVRPLHLWLSPEALVVVALAPWLAVQLAVFVAAHRATAFAVAAPIVITLLLLEGALRLVNAVRPIYVFYTDSSSRFRGQPGARHFDATLNSRGFNDIEHPVERPADVAYRIVALGDSFAVGSVPQGDNFLTRLESLLSTGAPVEVINMGVSATNPVEYLSMLADEGLAFRPDLVLVNLFVGNDLESREPRWHERSYLVTLARALWRLGRSADIVSLPAGEASVYDDNAPAMNQDTFMEIQVGRSWIYERDSPDVTAAVSRAAGFVRRMRDLARAADADLLVALLPDETQINADLRARVVAARELGPTQFDWGQPNRLLAQALADEQIEVLDLLPALTDAATRERLYKPADTHWNLAGNRVAAEVMARTLAGRVAQAARGSR